ncbi:MAG: hypothetical protein WCQ53_01210 [bacterium]
MKVLKNLKGVMIVSSLMLVIGACGKQSQSISPALANSYMTGSCDATSTGANVFDGTISDGSDPIQDSYGITTGSVKLIVTTVGGVISGQFAGSAVLTLNGSQYCCTSQGISGVLGQPQYATEKATVLGLTLACQATSASTGFFSTSYQAITLTIGVPVQVPGYQDGTASLRTDQRLRGYIKLSSGVQGLGGVPNASIHFVM